MSRLTVDGSEVTTDEAITPAQARELVALVRAAEAAVAPAVDEPAVPGLLLERRAREQLVLREQEGRDRAALAERYDVPAVARDRRPGPRHRGLPAPDWRRP